MFDVSNFLLRWMFLSNLCRDVADIQTLPTQPYYDQQHHHQQQQPHHHYTAHHQHPEIVWKEQCLRGILSYPPGSQRTLVLDALRTELVQQLAHKLQLDQSILQQYRDSTAAATDDGIARRRGPQEDEADDDEIYEYDNADDEESSSDPFLDADLEIVRAFGEGATQSSAKQTTSKNPLAKARTRNSEKQTASLVIDEYGPSVRRDGAATEDSSLANLQQSTLDHQRPDRDDAYRENSYSNTNSLIESSANIPKLGPPPPDYLARVHEASRSIQLTRDYLPQLVAAVLKSPPAFDAEVINPIQKLRSLLLQRCCFDDPGVGIELCWLLEAEVGRAWKTLFEHRQQQPGRRLIVVLPADRAMALAKIGSEKREAFDWLQEAEQATAFGFTTSTDAITSEHHEHHHSPLHSSMDDDTSHHQQQHSSTRLPSSLSLSRCSHFGDTMHFIDKLTQLSSDLRMVPEAHRKTVLEEGLYELNRRLRRRMVTRGSISLDVEDHRSPHDWPQIQDMSVDVMAHSVHLPLMPQTGRWPNGDAPPKTTTAQFWPTSMAPHPPLDTTTDETFPHHDVVRVLNIVVPETRILSSRERCPFLVHVEVADTGLETSNARLYASSPSTTGLTVREALGLHVANAPAATGPSSGHHWNLPTRPWGIPKELLLGREPKRRSPKRKLSTEPVGGAAQDEETVYNATGTAVADDKDNNFPSTMGLNSEDFLPSSRTFSPRGGFQMDGHYDENGYLYDPLASARQQDFEQLHRDLQAHSTMMAPPPSSQQQILHNLPKVKIGLDLLNNIFGREWNEKCKEIRDASPYGHVKGWRLASFILKSGEDIRREAFVMQIITKLQQWFEVIPESHRPILRPYTIMCVGADAGLVECLSNAKSIDEVKKQTDGFESLRDYFERAYGPPSHSKAQQYPLPHSHQHSADVNRGAISFEEAQDNFLRSLVGYSLVCYILQVKDRHNANILIDRFARVVHIDYGFVLGDTPKMGKVPLFSERAPFKLSSEFWEVLGGWNFQAGGLGVQFCKMFEIAFACAATHSEEIATLAEAAMLSLDSNARSSRIVANGIRARLRMRGPPGSRAQKMFIMDLVNAALTSWGTSTYDWLQRSMNGYQ